MSMYRGRAERLSVYGVAGLFFFFAGCVAVVLAAALSVEWLCALWGVLWTAAVVMAVVGVVKSD